MLGFIAEYTGKAVGYIVETAEDAWEETTSMADRFSQGYNSVTNNPPAPKKDDDFTAPNFNGVADIMKHLPKGESNVPS